MFLVRCSNLCDRRTAFERGFIRVQYAFEDDFCMGGDGQF